MDLLLFCHACITSQQAAQTKYLKKINYVCELMFVLSSQTLIFVLEEKMYFCFCSLYQMDIFNCWGAASS
jgi:hypothetical protein